MTKQSALDFFAFAALVCGLLFPFVGAIVCMIADQAGIPAHELPALMLCTLLGSAFFCVIFAALGR